MKSELRKHIEYLLVKQSGCYGCKNVEIDNGELRTRYLIPIGDMVDYMTITRHGEISCYEIRTTKEELFNTTKQPFYGHRNFYVIPEELFNEINSKRRFLEMLEMENRSSIGVIIVNDKNELLRGFASGRVDMPTWKETLLLESFASATAKEAKKLYELEHKNETT